MKAAVIYGKVVEGRYGLETVREGAIPEQVPKKDEEGNDTTETFDQYSYNDELFRYAHLNAITRENGQEVTVLIIDGAHVPEALIWKAVGAVLGK